MKQEKKPVSKSVVRSASRSTTRFQSGIDILSLWMAISKKRCWLKNRFSDFCSEISMNQEYLKCFWNCLEFSTIENLWFFIIDRYQNFKAGRSQRPLEIKVFEANPDKEFQLLVNFWSYISYKILLKTYQNSKAKKVWFINQRNLSFSWQLKF